jgi:hypothetical protein
MNGVPHDHSLLLEAEADGKCDRRGPRNVLPELANRVPL